MDVEKTTPQTIVPEKTEDYSVTSINIIPSTQMVRVDFTDQNFTPRSIEADLSAEWATVSPANKTIIKTFLKRVVAVALAVSDTDITGDALP